MTKVLKFLGMFGAGLLTCAIAYTAFAVTPTPTPGPIVTFSAVAVPNSAPENSFEAITFRVRNAGNEPATSQTIEADLPITAAGWFVVSDQSNIPCSISVGAVTGIPHLHCDEFTTAARTSVPGANPPTFVDGDSHVQVLSIGDTCGDYTSLGILYVDGEQSKAATAVYHILCPTPVPTATPTQQPTSTPTPTATASPLPPTATAIPSTSVPTSTPRVAPGPPSTGTGPARPAGQSPIVGYVIGSLSIAGAASLGIGAWLGRRRRQ